MPCPGAQKHRAAKIIGTDEHRRLRHVLLLHGFSLSGGCSVASPSPSGRSSERIPRSTEVAEVAATWGPLGILGIVAVEAVATEATEATVAVIVAVTDVLR